MHQKTSTQSNYLNGLKLVLSDKATKVGRLFTDMQFKLQTTFSASYVLIQLEFNFNFQFHTNHIAMLYAHMIRYGLFT